MKECGLNKKGEWETRCNKNKLCADCEIIETIKKAIENDNKN